MMKKIYHKSGQGSLSISNKSIIDFYGDLRYPVRICKKDVNDPQKMIREVVYFRQDQLLAITDGISKYYPFNSSTNSLEISFSIAELHKEYDDFYKICDGVFIEKKPSIKSEKIIFRTLNGEVIMNIVESDIINLLIRFQQLLNKIQVPVDKKRVEDNLKLLEQLILDGDLFAPTNQS